MELSELKSVTALELLRNVRDEFYAGLLFHRAGVPCDERDIEYLHAAYTMLLAVIEAQKEPSNRAAGASVTSYGAKISAFPRRH
jgi:hypothetical protein